MGALTGLSAFSAMPAIFGVSGTYADKVLGYGPIAYWPLWEAAGLTAECLVNSPAQDGTYVGVTLGQSGIGDGRTCPLFDGANDYVDIYSVPLNTDFDGDEGTAAIWVRALNAAVWTDAAFRRIAILRADGNNRILLARTNVNNNITLYHIAGGVNSNVAFSVFVTTFFHVAITWSDSAGANGEVKVYLNAVQQGLTQAGQGVWAGNLNALTCLIGADDQVPSIVWKGYLAHSAVWDRPLTQPEIADLATV